MAALDKFTGTLLVSIILSSILFGILTVQTRLYLARYPDDRKWMKMMVVGLWFTDFVHQSFACLTIYHYAISFHHPEILAQTTWSLSAFHTLEPMLALVVQMFFAHRLLLLNPRWWPIALAMAALAVASCGFGLAAAVTTYSLEYWSEFTKYTWLVIAWLALCAACDIMVSGAIACSLFLSRSGFKATDQLISKLILWTINTGAFPALFAILELTFFLTMPDSFTYMAADIVLAKLYSNSLLAFLNRRRSVLDNKSQSLPTLRDYNLSTINFGLHEIEMHPISDISVRTPKPTRWAGVTHRS